MSSLLSGLPGALTVEVLFADSPDVPRDVQELLKSDTAVIQSAALFDKLCAYASSSSKVLERSNGVSRTYAAIDLPPSFSPSQRRKGRLPSLVLPIAHHAHTHGAHTSSSEAHPGSSDETSQYVVLPIMYRRFFADKHALDPSTLHVSIRPHSPLTLSHLVLSAHSPSAFAYAQESQDLMERQIDGRLMRQNDVIGFGNATFSVILAEPVLQGIALQQRTEIFITFDKDSHDERVDSLKGHVDQMSEESIEDDYAGDRSNIVVDEHFFTKGILDSLESNADQRDGGNFFADTSGTNFMPIAVQDIAVMDDALQSWASRAWRDVNGFDVEDCVMLEESVFPQIGAFDGDWALAEIDGQGKARAVKMLCAPRGFQGYVVEGARQTLQLPPVFLSPLLLQNLHAAGQFDPVAPLKPITLRSLGSWQLQASEVNRSNALPDCPLPLPFADSLTISRVASSLSVNRKYQSLFLGALRDYFEGARRIVQQGDIFAVSFDKSKVQWAVEESSEAVPATAAGANGNANDEAFSISLPTFGAQDISCPTGIVYFCVTDVAPELCEPMNVHDKAATDTDLWIHEMARTGQFGCAVDTTLTKMVQSGLTKSRVIDTSQWLHSAAETPCLPTSVSPLTAPDSVYGKLLKLVQATLLDEAAQFGLHLSVLLKGARGCGKRTVARWVAQRTGIHLVELNCYDLIGDSDARTEGVLRARVEQAAGCAPAMLVLYHIEALARKSQALETGQEPTMANVLQDCLSELRMTKSVSEGEPLSTHPMPIAVIGTTGDADRCPTGVLACFRHELAFEAPNEAERYAILGSCLADAALSVDVDVNALATQTAALVASDLVDLVGRAKLASVDRIYKQQMQDREPEEHAEEHAEKQAALDASIVEAGVALTGSDFDVALAKARLSYSENIGAPKIPNVTWDDVGGLISVKDDILDTIQLPLEHPELFSNGLKKRSGILLYGPPGTGKTLLAKAVATSCSLNFFSVKGPELLNMYIGESEANVRRVFQRARDAKPCVIFFDELDSIAPKRGNQGDSGGVMDRIVSQLLAELDGMSAGGTTADVFVIGATNRPDLLDPALLRPGRFDRMLYLAVSQTHAEQLNILQALTRKFKLDEDVGDLSVVAEQCPMNLTGADFYALCSDAMLKSMTRKAEWIDGRVTQTNKELEQARMAGEIVTHPLPLTSQYYLEELAEASELDVKVSRADFEAALHELVPSVSAQEMEHYRSVQQRFSNTDADGSVAQDNDAVAVAVNGMSMHDGENGAVQHAPIEYAGNQTIAQAMAAMQSAARSNGLPEKAHANGASNGETFAHQAAADEARSRAKGKGKARE